MDNNIEPPIVERITTPTRVTTFLRLIVDRVGGFSYPPKVGTRQCLDTSSSGSSSGTSSTTQAMVARPPQCVAAPPMPTMATPPPQAMAPLPQALVKFITCTFLVFLEGTRWSPNGVPTITHWLANPKFVVVSLPNTKRWAEVNYPIACPHDSVEWHVAEVFGRLLQYQNIQSPYPHVTGTFFKQTRKRKGVGQDRAYKLEIYTQDVGGLYGNLSANIVVAYLPAATIHPSANTVHISTGSLHAPIALVPPSTAIVRTSPGSLVPSIDSIALRTIMQHTTSSTLQGQ